MSSMRDNTEVIEMTSKTKSKGKRKPKIKTDNAGHGRLEHGTYHRSDTKKTATYSVRRDARRKSKNLPYDPSPKNGKPFTGDNKKVLYNPNGKGYIVLARRDSTGKWKPNLFDGNATKAKKVKRYKKWKVGYV